MTHKPIHVEKHNFLRPQVDFYQLHSTSDPLTFMVTDMDDCNSITTQWDVEKRLEESVRPHYWNYYVRLFGVTADGRSVSVYVSGFRPFVYVQAPKKWQSIDMELALTHLQQHVAPQHSIRFNRRDVAFVEKTWRTQLYGFTNHEKIDMFKLHFNSLRSRENFIKLCDAARTWNNYANLKHEFWLWDACVPPLTQSVNVHDIMPSYWITVAADKYSYHDAPTSRNNVRLPFRDRRTRAQIDIDCEITALSCDKERPDVAPLLIESWDIEVKGRPGIFPQPELAEDEVIQIGSTVQRYGDEMGQYAFQCCFCLGETENPRPDKVRIYWFESEAQLLEAYYYYWTDCVDADVRIAYNQYGFDEPYLYNRYMKLLTHMIPRAVLNGTARYYEQGALDYGKVRNSRSALQSNFSGSRAHGGRTKHTVKACGRVQIDLLAFASENWGINWLLSLNMMSEKVLGKDEQKEDVHYSQITPMWKAGAKTRGKLAAYCVRDTELPLMIVQKKCVIIEQVEKSRLTGVTLDKLCNMKQTVRVETQLFREAHRSKERYAIPQQPLRFVKDPHLLALFRGEHGKEGALVLEATPNFYPMPIVTLDFAGLYPSIIRGYGLCYTTLILDPKYLKTTEYRVDTVRNKTPGAKPYKMYWAKPKNGEKPFLYRVLTRVLEARAEAKKRRGAFLSGTFDYSVLDARQLALKIVANSIYGYTVINYEQCQLPCAAIGVTVTHYGRQLINRTRDEVHKRVAGSRCIYGDTDSVMIKLSDDASAEAFRRSFLIGHQLAADITALFPPEVVLEFEKTYYPYCQWMQKVYAGILYESADEKGKVKCKGLASVKNDTIGVVRDWTQQIVTRFLHHDHDGAKRYLVEQLAKFVNEPVAAESVAKTVKMSKEIEMYSQSNEVATVAAAMRDRDAGSAPGAGDKVTFLHCLDTEHGNKAVAVDIDHYNTNKRRYHINKMHYLRNLIAESVGKLFDLPTVAQDPYHWFAPFERSLKVSQNGSGIAQFMTAAKHQSGMESFPMSLFKNDAYPRQSALKKKRVKKAEKKHFADECRRLEVSQEAMRRKKNKRKHGVPISAFFKTRKLAHDGE